jgi:hypothetical protein
MILPHGILIENPEQKHQLKRLFKTGVPIAAE